MASGVKSVQLFFIINQPDALIFQNFYFGRKLYMFQTVPLSIIRSFSLYVQQTCMTYTIAVCTVKNS